MAYAAQSKPSPFTCTTCNFAFLSADQQRLHFKSDLHHYNLKRKVAGFPPVNYEEFQRRVNANKQKAAASELNTRVYCGSCCKLFRNENAFANHQNSKKHKENETKFGNSDPVIVKSPLEVPLENLVNSTSDSDCSEVEEVDSDEWEDMDQEFDDQLDCLFCDFHAKTFYQNVDHMTNTHSFFIPDIEFCTDLQGLVEYLSAKVNLGFRCLWCPKRFRYSHNAKQHMVDKGHCMINHEGIALAEYADFYDYSSSYPDADDENVDIDEEIVDQEVEGDGYQLILPSGAVVGHRSLMRYYKQSIKRTERQLVRKNKDVSALRSLGRETDKNAAEKKARDLLFMKRVQAKLSLKMGMMNNKLQKHVRRQVPI